jgi:hypothetical protein
MNHLHEWVHLIARQLKSEAELIGVQAKSELYEDAARNTFVRMVLDPFLPASYTVGSGKVIDAAGNISLPQDIVIYRSDFPQFNMPGSHDVFIYESVLATIQVRSKLVRKSFFSAMDQCASLGTLTPAIDLATRRTIAEKMKMQADTQHQYLHPDPLHTGRFNLIARPHCFIYAFTGYQTSEHQLAENLTKWIDFYHQNQDHAALQMKSLPSVIATQGCFAWRNAAPFTFKQHALMGVGSDTSPLRLIILQLMHALNRHLQNTSDGYGIKSTIAPYLAQFEAPKITLMVGTALNPGDKKPAPINSPVPQQLAAKVQPPSAEKIQATVGKPVQAEKQAATTDSDQNESQPQIKDFSALRSSIATASSNQPQVTSPITKSTNPLSTFSSGDEKEEVEEYKFDPIEHLKPEPEPEPAEKAEQSGEDPLLKTQLIDNPQPARDHNMVNKDFEKTQKLPDKLIGQKKAKDSKDPFTETLIEAPEPEKKVRSDSSEKKSEYVTETLI